MSDLTTKAVCVSLNISAWSARKFDKTATADVNKNFSAQNAGRFNKMLVDSKLLQPITQKATAMRKYHITNTLPWSNGGDRVLPATRLVAYRAKMLELRAASEYEVEKFCLAYDKYVQEAKLRLGNLYNPNEYPPCDELKKKFKTSVSYAPIPKLASDFRLDSSVDHVTLRTEIELDLNKRHIEATQDLTKRAGKAVKSLVDAVNRAKGKTKGTKFSQSLIDNLRDLIEIMPDMNYTNDPTITELATELKDLVKYDKDALKTDGVAQDFVSRRAEELKNRFF